VSQPIRTCPEISIATRSRNAASAAPSTYPFSIIELRLTPKGDGEGRGAIFGKVTVDGQSKTIALDGYTAVPVVLKGVKKG